MKRNCIPDMRVVVRRSSVILTHRFKPWIRRFNRRVTRISATAVIDASKLASSLSAIRRLRASTRISHL